LVGLIIVFPVWYVSGYLWGKFVARTVHIDVPTLFGEVEEDLPKNPPAVSTVIMLLLLPMVLIFLNTGLSTLASSGVVDGDSGLIQSLIFLGNSPVALLISVVVATIVLGNLRGEEGSVLEKVLDFALGPISSVVLITGAGG